jgi:hypothetical protein
MIGFHSMMESPLPESRVIAPMIAIAKIIAAQISNQIPTARSRAWTGRVSASGRAVRDVVAWVMARGT